MFTFLYYANKERDDVMGVSAKIVQHSIKNISRNNKAVFFKLGIRNAYQIKNTMTLSYVSMTTVMTLLLL